MPEETTTKPKRPKQRSGVTASFREPKSRTTVGWTPALGRSAERQADGGYLMLAADLVTTMLGDDRLRGVTETLGGVCSLPMLFEPGSRGVDPKADPACQALQEGDWWQVLPESTQAEIVVWGRLLGVAVCCITEWRLDEETGRVHPVVDVWSPRWARWNEDTAEWEITTATGVVKTRGNDGTWLIFTAYRKTKGWQVAPWKGLWRLWLLKQLALVDWPDDSDKHAQGKNIIERVDFTIDGGNELVCPMLTNEEGRKLAAEINSIGRTGTIKLPDGYKASLLESTGKSSDVYERQINLTNTAYAITMLGQNLSTEVTAGAFASTSIHNLVKQDRIRAVAEWMTTSTHEQLLPWWNDYNFGSGRTPWAKYDTTPPSDAKAEADRLAIVASAIGSFSNANVPLDLEQVGTKYDIPIDVKAAANVQQAQLFQYHLTFGLLTINEARTKWLRLPPIKGGDVIPAPQQSGPPDAQAMGPGQQAYLAIENFRRWCDKHENAAVHAAKSDDTTGQNVSPPPSMADQREALVAAEQKDADAALEQGNDYIDGLQENGMADAVKILRPTVDELVAIVKKTGAEDAETEEQRVAALKRLRAAVLEQYDELDPLVFADTVRRVEMLASMAGSYSVTAEI